MRNDLLCIIYCYSTNLVSISTYAQIIINLSPLSK